VRQALRELRLQIWEELAAGSQFILYTPHKFLPDTYIERIVSMSGSLTTEDNLQVALANFTCVFVVGALPSPNPCHRHQGVFR
jgi:hypothetical protein